MTVAKNMFSRREFLRNAAMLAGAGAVAPLLAEEKAPEEDAIAVWNRETELVSPADYGAYRRDGKTRGFASLEKLEAAFAKVLREVKETVVTGDVPAVWSVYNMGYIVKTPKALFAIDLQHRRAAEFAPLLDFMLVTHNHADHFHRRLYERMDGAGKIVISNFLDNYGVWGKSGQMSGGYTRAEKEFSIKDVRIHTSLIDHNRYLIDFTTAFEIRIGDFVLYHTGDSGAGTEPKLHTVWGRPDLWLFFPGCGIDTAKAVAKVNAKRIVFGHLWELGHNQGHRGRLDERLIRPRLVWAKEAGCRDVSLAFWGDRIL